MTKAPCLQPFSYTTSGCSGAPNPLSKVTAVAQAPLCRYQLGLGIYNVQTAVEGMDGGKKSYLLHLCGQLLRLVLIPCHIKGEPHNWIRSTAISYAAELMDMYWARSVQLQWRS